VVDNENGGADLGAGNGDLAEGAGADDSAAGEGSIDVDPAGSAGPGPDGADHN
jgi:hypothetical protein